MLFHRIYIIFITESLIESYQGSFCLIPFLIYKDIPEKVIPDTESLKDTYERVSKYFEEEIKQKLKNKNVLISAHGNSIRALCKKMFDLDNYQISDLEIPTGNPLIIELNNDSKIVKCEYLDKERAKSLVVF